MSRDLSLLVLPPDVKWCTFPPAPKWGVGVAVLDRRASMPARLSTLSTEYLTVQVSARESGTDVDLSATTVRFAFKAEGDEPEVADWSAGTWDTDSSTVPTRYYARVLVGPDDGVELAAGTYVVWLEVTDDPETVVRQAGYVRVV